MYYSYPCSYCGKVFYTFGNNKKYAAEVLYEGIKNHLINYDEDHKEYKFDESPQIEARQMYTAMTETSDRPQGGYPL